MNDYPYILVAFLRDLPVDHEFERWPHHITVLPWFKADDRALKGLGAMTGEHLPITVELAKTDMFGARNDILVRIVESKELVILHNKLLRDRGGILGLANSRHVSQDFRPHITLQGQNDPGPGRIPINRIYLIKHTGPGRTKRVEEIFG